MSPAPVQFTPVILGGLGLAESVLTCRIQCDKVDGSAVLHTGLQSASPPSRLAVNASTETL